MARLIQAVLRVSDNALDHSTIRAGPFKIKEENVNKEKVPLQDDTNKEHQNNVIPKCGFIFFFLICTIYYRDIFSRSTCSRDPCTRKGRLQQNLINYIHNLHREYTKLVWHKQKLQLLTLFMLWVPLKIVILIHDTFEYNLRTKHGLTRYLKESCR